jgi:hypothetical protein
VVVLIEFDDVDLGNVATCADAVDTCHPDLLFLLKLFSPITSGSVAHCSRCCCTEVVLVVAVTVAVLGLFVVGALVVTVAIVVPVECTARLDHIACVLGHPFNQSLSGAVVIILTALGCSFLWGMTIVYCESAGRFRPGLCLASMSLSNGL